jgi:aspartyl-tRNA(Asn)/glutamyl-tRNA(Gln) amidotransferase subunit B
MRSKEDAHDYRYFPDPDLPTLEIASHWVDAVRASLPELPSARRERYERDCALSAYDATTLTASRATADYFEAVLAALAASPTAAQAKSAANWVMGEVAAALNRDGLEIGAAPVTPAQVAALIRRVDDGTVSGKIARELFALLWAEPQSGDDAPDRLIDARGLRQISDTDAIGKLVDEVIAANPKSVEEFRAGKDKAFNALVGQVMKASRGKANPQQVNDALRARLG